MSNLLKKARICTHIKSLSTIVDKKIQRKCKNKMIGHKKISKIGDFTKINRFGKLN